MKISKMLLVALAVPVVLGAFVLFSPENAAAANASISNGVSAANGANSGTSLSTVFKTIINVMLFIVGALSVLMLIYGGIRYTLSGGDSGSVTSAKNTILYAIIGLVVAFLAYAIVNWVLGALTGNATTA